MFKSFAPFRQGPDCAKKLRQFEDAEFPEKRNCIKSWGFSIAPGEKTAGIEVAEKCAPGKEHWDDKSST